MARDNRSLGRFHLDGIMSAPRGIPKIECTIDIDANAFVKLISYDPQTVIDNRKIMRIGKYAKMIINMYRLKNLKWEDMDLVKDYLTLVYHQPKHLCLEYSNPWMYIQLLGNTLKRGLDQKA